MKLPCDEAAIKFGEFGSPCGQNAGKWILTATILGSSMAFIDSTVVNVALPAIQAGFHTGVVGVQWVVESYGLFLSAWVLTGGAMGDLFGRRKIFLIGVVIFAAASFACGLAPSIELLILARSLQGLGAALLVPGSLAIISASFEEKKRGAAIGTWSGFTAITTAIGPVLGGWLVEHISWRWAFFINLPLAAMVVVISLWRLPESRSAGAGPVDRMGALSVTLGLGGLVSGFIESTNLGWKNPLVFGSLAAGLACLVAFVFVEAKTDSPMVPLNVFKSRAFSGANLLTLFLYAAIGIFFFLFPLNLIQVQGYSAVKAGAAVLPMSLLMLALSRWSGALVTRYGARLPLIVGPVIVAAGFALFVVPSVGGSYWKSFFPGVMVVGFGLAIAIAPLTTVVMDSAGEDHVGVASGINNAVARVAGVLAIAVLGIVMTAAFRSRLNHEVAKLALPPAALEELRDNETKLAGMELPVSVDPGTKEAIRKSVELPFVSGFRLVMVICAGLAASSAAATWCTIPRLKSTPSN
jgi:EmrB/QacA subfamily drug resistance transporter